MNRIRKIMIEQGKAFHVKNASIQEADLFMPEYEQAAAQLENILGAYQPPDNQCKEADFPNNVIAFTGDRGQGKTSAMYAFKNELVEREQEKRFCAFGTRETYAKCITTKFYSIDAIDPSAFEERNDIIEVIVARMYKKIETRYQHDNTSIDENDISVLMNYFQKAYEAIAHMRNQDKWSELESGYETSLQKISSIADSANLRNIMQELVRLYLKAIGGDEKSWLIIPIDDLDMYISRAYHLAEELRKYLIIPRVVLIIAIKINQLHDCVEGRYRSELHEETNMDPQEMAAKYIEKLIPETRRIYLPEISAMDAEGDVEIYYKKVDGKEQLLCDAMNLFKSQQKAGAEKTLFALIFKQTRIMFVHQENIPHPMIPNTLREYVNLLSLFCEMESPPDEEEGRNAVFERNLLVFETYLVNTWINGKLDRQDAATVRALSAQPDDKKARYVCERLLQLLRGQPEHPIIGNMDEQIKLISKELLERAFQTPLHLGDVVSAIRICEDLLTETAKQQFLFVLKTLYTIILHKLRFRGQDYKNPALRAFIGDDFWGYKINYKAPMSLDYRVRDVIRRTSGESAQIEPRTKFSYSTEGGALLSSASGQDGTLIYGGMSKEDKENSFLISLFSNPIDGKTKNKAPLFTIENSSKRSRAEFDLQLFMLNLLDFDSLLEKNNLQKKQDDKKDETLSEFSNEVAEAFHMESVYLCLLNIEVASALYSYLKAHYYSKGNQDEAAHYLNFFEMLNSGLAKIAEYFDLNEDDMQWMIKKENIPQFSSFCLACWKNITFVQKQEEGYRKYGITKRVYERLRFTNCPKNKNFETQMEFRETRLAELLQNGEIDGERKAFYEEQFRQILQEFNEKFSSEAYDGDVRLDQEWKARVNKMLLTPTEDLKG